MELCTKVIIGKYIIGFYMKKIHLWNYLFKPRKNTYIFHQQAAKSGVWVSLMIIYKSV